MFVMFLLVSPTAIHAPLGETAGVFLRAPLHQTGSHCLFVHQSQVSSFSLVVASVARLEVEKSLSRYPPTSHRQYINH